MKIISSTGTYKTIHYNGSYLLLFAKEKQKSKSFEISYELKVSLCIKHRPPISATSLSFKIKYTPGCLLEEYDSLNCEINISHFYSKLHIQFSKYL